MPVIETDEAFLIIRATNRKEFKEIELLLLSRSVPFSVQGGSAIGNFYVPLEYESMAMDEIRTFRKENRNWPPVMTIQEGLLFRFSPVHFGMVIALTLFHWWLSRVPESRLWTEGGMLAVDKVLSGEWYRTVTALTLHADAAHLLSNLFGLLVFVGGVHQFTGAGLSWLLVLISGAVGNLGTALFYQSAHNSVGASTAVFAAVGLMGAFGVRRYLVHQQFRKRSFIPLIGALGLFAMLGTHPGSDVMAHVFGLISGGVIGLILTPLPGSRIVQNRLIQVVAWVVAMALILLCWQVQLQGFDASSLGLIDLKRFSYE
jgi:membrane associated rhomboid family serine protease